MNDFVENTLSSGADGDKLLITGSVDIWVLGLTSGSVKLEVKFPHSSDWREVPDNTYTADTCKTMTVSERGVYLRVVGDDNNAGVYVRLGRGE